MRPHSELLYNLQNSTGLRLQRDLVENDKPQEMEHSMEIQELVDSSDEDRVLFTDECSCMCPTM